MRQFNVFQALFMSFYSRRLYRDVAFNWGGQSFAYLLLLLALAWVVFTYQIQLAINSRYTRFSNTTVAQIPVMTIKDGKLSTPENRPYIVTVPGDKTPIMVIDTSGRYTSLDQIDTDILVTTTKIHSKQSTNQERVGTIPSSTNAVLVPDKINGYIKNFIGFLWIPIFFFALLGSYLYRIVQSLVYGILGKVIAIVLGVKLTYWQIVQIMMVAITPVIVLCTLLRVIEVDVMHHNLFYFTLAMVYLAFGIYANKTTTREIL